MSSQSAISREKGHISPLGCDHTETADGLAYHVGFTEKGLEVLLVASADFQLGFIRLREHLSEAIIHITVQHLNQKIGIIE